MITGEEKIIPVNANIVYTVESMPIDKDLEFVGVDEIRYSYYERGHILLIDC